MRGESADAESVADSEASRSDSESERLRVGGAGDHHLCRAAETHAPSFARVFLSPTRMHKPRVSYFYDSEIGNHHYGQGHPMKVRMACAPRARRARRAPPRLRASAPHPPLSTLFRPLRLGSRTACA